MATRLTIFCVVIVMGFAANEAHVELSRFRRADDSDPLRPVVEQLAQQFQQLQAQVQANKNNIGDIKTTVGFTVRLAHEDISGLGVGQIIKFDDVIFNAGNGYSPVTGLFTAPLSGTYVLMLKTMHHRTLDPSNALVDIMKNGVLLARSHTGYSIHESGSSGMYVVHLDQGDVVHVQIDLGTRFFGGIYTVFSGFRLMP